MMLNLFIKTLFDSYLLTKCKSSLSEICKFLGTKTLNS